MITNTKLKCKYSGIYFIRNLITNDIYIGSSVDLRGRFSTHKRDLLNKKHANKYLQNSYNKYGGSNFIFEIKEIYNKYNLKDIEYMYLLLYQPKYNIAKTTNCPMQGRKHGDSFREKMKSKFFPQEKNHPLYGRKLSKEHIKKVRLSQIGSRCPDKTKEKMSETAKRINSISGIDRSKFKRKIIDNTGKVYSSLVECSSLCGKSSSTISDILKGRHSKTRCGLSFKYLDEEGKRDISLRGQNHHNSTISDFTISEIRICAKNKTPIELSKLYNISITYIRRIIKGKVRV